MPTQTVAQTVLFPTLFPKPLVATFDTPQQSSDGGAILLKAIDDQLGLTARLAACLPEWRQAGKVEHDLPNKGIAERLFISEGTVKSHLHNIYEKLRITNLRVSLHRERPDHSIVNTKISPS